MLAKMWIPFLQDLVALGDDPLAHVGRGIDMPVAQVGAAEALSSFEPLRRLLTTIAPAAAAPPRLPSCQEPLQQPALEIVIR